jgi:hypothetical protein
MRTRNRAYGSFKGFKLENAASLNSEDCASSWSNSNNRNTRQQVLDAHAINTRSQPPIITSFR